MTRIFQVCGFQNTGKTSVVTKVISHFAAVGIKAAVLKHHGHGGKLAVGGYQKDSERYLEAGAHVSLAAGGGSFQVLADGVELDLMTQLKVAACLEPDLILIEGYKMEGFPKILMIREEKDLALVEKTMNVKGIITWPEAIIDNSKIGDIQHFSLEDPRLAENVCRLILETGSEF
ncbi:molybdopterin-guanine dinucleotide biosynthesis protein B [Peribacillus sp. SCS-37]|uniref:molybdopterin-guanine dinucleotide biosynthesis protein B n=1 Tax=Paraperibacillus esterisolvens TaxID=3115296 RepID=UPI003905999F